MSRAVNEMSSSWYSFLPGAWKAGKESGSLLSPKGMVILHAPYVSSLSPSFLPPFSCLLTLFFLPHPFPNFLLFSNRLLGCKHKRQDTVCTYKEVSLMGKLNKRTIVLHCTVSTK